MQSGPAANRRHNCNRGTATSMPAVEVGLVMQFGSVPVVMVRLSDPNLLRLVVDEAVARAAESGDIAAQQQARLAAQLLAQVPAPTVM